MTKSAMRMPMKSVMRTSMKKQIHKNNMTLQWEVGRKSKQLHENHPQKHSRKKRKNETGDRKKKQEEEENTHVNEAIIFNFF